MLGLDVAYLYIKFGHSSFSRFRDIVGALQNLNGSRDLTTPLSGVIWNFVEIFLHQKTRVPGLSHSDVCVILGLAIFVELRLVTDGQTDRHTMTAYTALTLYRAVKNLVRINQRTKVE